MKAELDKAWAERCKLQKKGHAIDSKGDALWGAGSFAEGRELWDKAQVLWTKVDDLWEAEVHRLCGADALIEYGAPEPGDCTVQGVWCFTETKRKVTNENIT